MTRIGLEKLRPDPVFSCEYRFLEPVQDLWVFGRERPREQRSRALAKGTRPLGFPSFLGLWGRDFGFCPAGSPCVVESPAYPFFRKEKIQPCVRRSVCDAERFERALRRRKYPARRRELFSLRKKRPAGIRLSAWQWFGSLYRLDPTPFSALQIMGIQGGPGPLGRARDSVSRPCPSPHPEILNRP